MLEKIKAVILAVLTVTGGAMAQMSGYLNSKPYLEKQHYANMCKHLQYREILPYLYAGEHHYDYYANCIATLHASDMGVECGFYPSNIWNIDDYASMTPDQFKKCMSEKAKEVWYTYEGVEGNVKRFRDAIAFIERDYEEHYNRWLKTQTGK